jgi:arginine decarboxylase
MNPSSEAELVKGSAQRVMPIYISTGIGEGPTPLAAFDSALLAAGVANYNLLCLSSVIPPNARIVRTPRTTAPDEYGRRLYVVLSQMRQHRRGRHAHAGIGWMQDEATGCGLFVELHDSDRARLRRALHVTLEAMRTGRDMTYGPVQTEIASAQCFDRPVCALVVAVYSSEPW